MSLQVDKKSNKKKFKTTGLIVSEIFDNKKTNAVSLYNSKIYFTCVNSRTNSKCVTSSKEDNTKNINKIYDIYT